MTALKADVQDIFLERTHPHEDNRYDVDGQWQAMEVREEQIRVRTEFPAYLNEPFEPVTWHVRSTRHGPLISDVLGKVDTPMALKWTALAEDDATYRGFYRLNYAHDWQSFNDALLDYNAPAMNFLYADVKGNIGYTVGGDIPVRADGDGRTPNMGWHSQGEWVGKIDKAALPKVFNPKSGYIVTANNKNHDADYPYYISNDWSPGYRATRISQLLDQAVAQGTRLKVEDMAQMQGDVKNLQAQQLIALFRQVQPQNSRQAKAIESLKQWDLEADMDSIGASIYHTWLRHFSKAILSDAFDTERLHIRRATEHRQITNSMFPLFLDRVVNGELSQWCDLPETDQVEDCVARAAKTLPATLDDLTLICGSDIDDWQWGELHQTLYAHNVFNKIKLLDRLFDRTINSGGDGYTVNVAMTFFTKDDGYRQVTGATYRSVVDLANWQNSGFISDTGQSGNLLSPHYDDFIPVHNRLGLHPMSFGQSQARGDTLLLTPASTNQ